MKRRMKDVEACVSAKIPVLIDEGYEQEQAVAIAYEMCSEGKWAELPPAQQSAFLAILERFPVRSTVVRQVGNHRVGGYGVLFGGPEALDLEGTYFTADTNFWLDTYKDQPVMYDHALMALEGQLAELPEDCRLGTVRSVKIDDMGIWIEAEIERRDQWAEAVMELIRKGALHWSSGSVPHLVMQRRDGWLSSWPIIEMSMTPTPAEWRGTNIVPLKHYVQQSQGANPQGAPAKGAQGPGSRPVLSTGKPSSVEGNAMKNEQKVKALAESLVSLRWDTLAPAIRQEGGEVPANGEGEGGTNAIEELARPLAEELAALAGCTVDEALAIIVGVIADYARTEDAGEPPEDAGTEGEYDVQPVMLSVDVDDLAARLAARMAPEPVRKPRGGRYTGKNVNLNLAYGRSPSSPLSLGPLVRAITRHDQAALKSHSALVREAHKAQGINPDTAGGYLVAPEQATEIIELLSATAVVYPMCRTVPMNQSDTMLVPKQTGGSDVSWVGENQDIPDSEITLGQVALIAKKMAALVYISNELVDDSSPSVEALVREDLARGMALEMDRVILEGNGVGAQPRGLLHTPGVTQTPLASAPGFGDLADAIYRIEDGDVASTPEWSWVFNPREKATLRQLEDTRGGYIFNELGTDFAGRGGVPPQLLGYPWATTTIIRPDAAHETRIYFGQWNDVLVGIRKSIELRASSEAGTAFQRDQTWIRAILRMDVNIRHEESIEILTRVQA